MGSCLKRFAVQLFCLWMGLYGPPVFALQEIAGERQAIEDRLQAVADEKTREQKRIERQIAEHLDDLIGSSSTAARRNTRHQLTRPKRRLRRHA